MEILCPAGYYEQIETAVNVSANAVYGGFSNWNARNNAVNLSVEQYNKAIVLLHNNGIKFYLTLNTLLLNDEIESIINFIKSGKILIPDAFIVADLGLLLRLREEIPEVPIHISTQFGVHSEIDIHLAETLGAERVILAREILISELSELKMKSNIELECFVWGSQCVSFSGLCFFGSLINGGTGNRGKCTNVCRDKYEYGSKFGTLFYVRDMNCINYSSALNKLVDSAKIEGRRRKCREINKVVEELKCKKSGDLDCGFLCINEFKCGMKTNMHKSVHNRLSLKHLYNLSNYFEKYDWFVYIDANGEKQYIKAEEIDKCKSDVIYYVFTEYTSYVLSEYNIYLDIHISAGNVIDGINFTNHKGEFLNVVSEFESNKKIVHFSIEEFLKEVQSKFPRINVARIKYIREKDEPVLISKEMYTTLLEHIMRYYINVEQFVYDSRINYPPLSHLFVETFSTDIALALISNKQLTVIVNIKSVSDIQKYIPLIKLNESNIIYKLPIFDWNNKLKNYVHLFEKRRVMFTRYSQIHVFSDVELVERSVDYTCHIWNTKTLKWLIDNGIEIFSSSPELDFQYNSELFKNQKCIYTFAGRLPLIYSRHCFGDILSCTICKSDKSIRNYDKNLQFSLSCNDDYRELYCNFPILNDVFGLVNSNSFYYRYIVTTESVDVVQETINIMLNSYRFCDVLKNKIPYWNSSYESNIYDGRQ